MELIGNGGITPLDKHNEYKATKWRLWQNVKDDNGRSYRTKTISGIQKRQALKELAKWRDELACEVPNKNSFSVYAASWLKWRASSGAVEDTTVHNNEYQVRALCREFGKDRMDALTPQRCRDGFTSIMSGNNTYGKKLSGAYMNKLYSVMQLIMQQAADDGKITANPLDKVQPPKTDTKEKRALTNAEWNAALTILESMPLDGRVAMCYGILTLGLRRAEAAALRTCDVDFELSIVHIVQSYKETTGRVGETKTRAGKRDLPMPQRFRDFMLTWDATRKATYGNTDTFFCNTEGGFLYPQNFVKWWKKNRAAIGCDGMSPHELRHTNLTIMSTVFTSPFQLMRWAGWSSIEPARVYLHDDVDALSAAIEGKI